MEFAVSDAMPIYAGGLGIVAGDFIKAAGDLQLPVVGVGIFWSEGFTTQRVNDAGMVWDEFPPVPRTGLTPTAATVSVAIRGREVPLTAWRLDQPGLAPLYLLEPMLESDRWITRRLYGGGTEDRVAQEMVLGIGGVRALRALGIDVDIYHFNEGHAVLAGLELIREKRAAGQGFIAAWQETRAEVVFTTNTPVAAGNEAHRIDLLMAQGAGAGFSADELAAIGDSPFALTVAGLRLSSVSSAVSELHGATARRIWTGLANAAPIVSVTNGVHPWTWQDARVRDAYSNGGLPEARQELKRELLATVRGRTGTALDEGRLLIGFARRAAPYKRADLIFRDLDRLGPLLRARKLQIVFGGKAHPQDDAGKRILADLAAAARRFSGSVVYLENYDVRLAQLLVRGCDVWLSTTRRPMEASGTSGMKAAMNGVVNLSVLDGWWPEACEHGRNGWQIGDGFEGPGQDEHDGAALLDLLEKEVVPAYEDAARWAELSRRSIEVAQWQFSAHRMVEDYYLRVYRHTAPLPVLSPRPPAGGSPAPGS
jgi:starch phosphorylase